MCATLICKPHVSESIITTRRLAPLVALLILLTLAGNNVIWAAISEDEIDDVSNLPGQGFNSIQYNPVTRQLTQIVWMETTDQFELLYLAREPNGTWSQELIIESDSGSYTWSSPAQLLYTSDGTPRIFLVDPDDDDLINHYQREAGGWQQVEVITIPDEPAFDFWAETLYVTAAVGPNDCFHIAVVTEDSPLARIAYGTNKDGTWQWDPVVYPENTDVPSYYFMPKPRYLSLAVDSANAAHISYTPNFEREMNPSGDRLFSELAYATNKSGSWTTEVVFSPPDNSADAGLGACVAIDPNGQPAIASFFVERASTGSAQFSRLYYHTPKPGEGWDSQIIVSSPDGYAAGDGAYFTGCAPYLLFDSQGQPHIAFSDYAGQHFSVSGGEEFAGQIRHVFYDSTQWNVATVYDQTDPIRNQMFYPAMAISSTELAFTGLKLVMDVGEPPVYEIFSSTFSLARVTIGDPPPIIGAQPTLLDVNDAGNAVADVTWQLPATGAPQYHVGCAYDLYTGQWVSDFSGSGMWYLFGGTDQVGQMNLGRSGAYYLWINSSYGGGGLYPCDNPWVGIISSGQPHQPVNVTAQNLGSRQVKVSWNPELYATWVYWLITYKNEDPNSGWTSVQGPLGDSHWHYTGYGVSETTLTMPYDGTYWVFLFAQGWNGQWSAPAAVLASTVGG